MAKGQKGQKRRQQIVDENELKLTPEQERFCHEFVKDLNATQAYLRSGFKTTNIESATANASRLLTYDKVQHKIALLNKEKLHTAKVDAQVILRELLALATSDITQILADDGSVLPKKDWPPHFKKAISQIQIDEIRENNMVVGYAKKIKMWDKPKALELLGRHLKLFTDVLEHKVSELSDEDLNKKIAELEGQKDE